jgi:hypothetical protein
MTRVACVVLVFTIVCVACPAPSTPSAPTRFPTGTAPNAATRVNCAGSLRALVTSSVDGSLNIIDIVDGTTTSTHFGSNTNPWDVAIVDDTSSVTGLTDPTAVVSLYGSNTIATTKVCSSTSVSSTYTDDEVIVSDGVEYAPGNPQAIAVIDNDIFVAFTNIVRVASGTDDMLTGPGTVVRLHLDDEGALVRDARLTLPCDNPSAIATLNGTLAVACTGRYRVASSGGFARASDSQGAIVVVDTATFTVGDVLAVDASPVSAVFDIDDSLVVGDALDGSVSRYSIAPIALVERAQPTAAADDSIFAVTIVNDTVVAAAFSGALVGAPFSASPQSVSVDEGLSRGMVDLAWQPGDVDVFAVMSLSAELVRVSTDGLVPAARVQP